MNDPCTAAMRICTIRSLRPFVYCKYKVGAGVVFTAGWVFIVFDTAVTVRARLADDGQFRSLRWFEWIRPLVAVLSFVAWLLCILSRLLAAAGEREKFIHHKANNQYYDQNEVMWQAAREEIPI